LDRLVLSASGFATRCDKEIARTLEDLDSTPILGWESPLPDEKEELTLKHKVEAELKGKEADAAARAADAAAIAGASDAVVGTWRRSEADSRREVSRASHCDE
jgi:hypothetical protein